MARGGNASSREPSERSLSPISVDRFPEVDDDVDVDVVECSDSEAPTRSARGHHHHHHHHHHHSQQQMQAGGAGTASSLLSLLASSKADLENIQNLKNQIGGGHHAQQQQQQQQQHHHNHHQHFHQHHPNHHHHHHHHNNHRLGGGGSNNLNACSAGGTNHCCLVIGGIGGAGGGVSEKNCHSKPLYNKKMLSHRNHHLLTSGSGNISIGGGNGVAGGGASGGSCVVGGGPTSNCPNIGGGGGGVGSNVGGCSCCCVCCGGGACVISKDGAVNGILLNGTNNISASSACGGGGSGSGGGSSVGSQMLYCGVGGGRSKFFLPDKRPRTEVIIPPTKFLLGGNISDPLNLNSLQNEALNSNSNSNTPATTPRRSPITTPPKVEVIIPPNIHDPLHLLDPVDSMEYEKQLISPMKRKFKAAKSKHRHRKKKPKRRRFDSINSSIGGGGGGGSGGELANSICQSPPSSQPPSPTTTTTEQLQRKSSMSGEAFSPAVGAAVAVADVSLGSEKNDSSMSFSSNSNNNNKNTSSATEENFSLDRQQPQSNMCHLPLSTANENVANATTSNFVSVTSETLMATAAAAVVQIDNVAAGAAQNVAVANIDNRRSMSPLKLSTVGGGIAVTISSVSSNSVITIAANTTATATTTPSATARKSLERERIAKDLRLDLTTTTTLGTPPTTKPINANSEQHHCQQHHHSNNGSNINNNNNNNNNLQLSSSRKRKTSESNSISQKNKQFRRLDSMDKIVSPVVPQPGAWKRPPRTVPTGGRKNSRHRSTSASETELLSPIEDAMMKPSPFDSDNSCSGRANETSSTDLENKNESDIIPGGGSPSTKNETRICDAKTEAAAGGGVANSTGDDIIKDSELKISACVVVATATSTANTSATANSNVSAIAAQPMKMPKFRPDGLRYQYGNYDRYTGFRHLNEFSDVRLNIFQRHIELFQNKDILDIGCNAGHMTITVARHLAPKSILGIDIDKNLIGRARRNLSMFVRIPRQQLEVLKQQQIKQQQKQAKVTTEPTAKDNKLVKQKKSKRKNRNHKSQDANQQQQQQHQHHSRNPNQLYVDSSELFPISFPLTYGGIPSSSLKCSSTSSAAIDECFGGAINANTTVTSSPSSSTSQLPTATSTSQPSSSPATAAAAQPPPTPTPSPSRTSPTAAAAPNQNNQKKLKNDFPKNVFFRIANYVLKDETQLNNDTQQYDLILCLSVTKWIHLNFGDNGLKLAFKRIFNQLRPGGKLILEAQNWASYKKKKNLTETIYKNYRSIEFFPNQFHEYLLSPEVGFSHSYSLGVPRHLSKGFCRPIQLYAKGDYTPNHVRWSDAYYPQTPYEAYRGIYATIPTRPPYMMSGGNYDTPHANCGSYSSRQTPMHQPTSQYYNPLETDSYLPSYDMEIFNQMYVFASPLYQTVWSPPASLRNSSSHTPLFGSVREIELEEGGSTSSGGGYRRHVYLPNDETSSPNANAGGAFSSIRDTDTDDSSQPTTSVRHVYANGGGGGGESSLSPQVNYSETLEGIIIDESSPQHIDTHLGGGASGGGVTNVVGGGCDSNDS